MSDNVYPGYDSTRGLALYERAFTSELPQNALVIFGADWCPNCQGSMHQNGYPTQLPNGQPLVWVNLQDPRAAQWLERMNIPYTISERTGAAIPSDLAGQQLRSVPTVTRLENGVVTEVLMNQAISPELFNQLNAQESARAASAPLRTSSLGSEEMVSPTTHNALPPELGTRSANV